MSKDMRESQNCNYCCCCSMNCSRNQRPELRKKDENGWLWAVVVGGFLAFALSGCVPEAKTSNPETLNSSSSTQMLVN